MTRPERPIAVLRLLTAPRSLAAGASIARVFPLVPGVAIVLGRDPDCQICLDSRDFGMVSRRHAEIVAVPLGTAGRSAAAYRWEIRDLGSSNGSFLNGHRLYDRSPLQSGDRLRLGLEDGPEFVFELQSATSATNRQVTLTQLFPIASTGKDLTRQAYLLPVLITISFVVALFFSVGQGRLFNGLLASYVGVAAYYFVYRLCGKPKPWLLLLGLSGGLMILLLSSPVKPLFLWIFRELLPGQIPVNPARSIALPLLLVQMFFGAGLMEELLKALPVLAVYWLGQCLPVRWQRLVGVREPLDGILVGAGSAVGFTLFETLGQYVPEVVQQANVEQGLQVLIPRLLGSIAGHVAYSGYLGYFIGLSLIKPGQAGAILTIGYLTASLLHALWNVSGFLHPLLLTLVGILSYAFLAAAILKARTLSPRRRDPKGPI